MILVSHKGPRFLLFIKASLFTLCNVLVRQFYYANKLVCIRKVNTAASVNRAILSAGYPFYPDSRRVKGSVFAILLTSTFSSFSEARSVTSLIEMRKHNVIVQQWDLSCGAAAVTTLLNYQHGDLVTEKEVANALMSRAEYVQNPGIVTIRQGFSLLDLKRYVDARGYKGLGYGKLSFNDLLKKAPIIVPVNIFGYNHFVIFRGVQGNRVLLADPAWGNRTMLVEQFENIRIDFPDIGKVGFVVSRIDGSEPLNLLAPDANDFVMTR